MGNVYPAITQYPEALKESFDTPDSLASWHSADAARWQWADGRVTCRSDNDSHADLLFTNTVFAGGLIEAALSLVEGGVGAAGLVVHSTPDFIGWKSGSAVFIALGTDGDGVHYAVFRQVDGRVGYLAPWTSLPGRQLAEIRVGVFTRGEAIQLYLDGELVWEGHSQGLDRGFIGFFGSTSPGFSCAHAFDNVSMRVRASVAEVAQAPADVAPKATEKAPKASRSKEKDAPKAVKPAPPTSAILGEDRSPLLRPGFVVRVSVLASGKREIDSEVKRVSDNYQLDLPLIGAVAVEGMTLTSLITDLQNRYKEFFINPQVVAEFVVEERADAVSPWGSVVVLGRVRSPGKVNIPPTQDLTVSGAIQQAGGLDTSARASSIRLTRRTADGKSERVNIDLTALGQQGDPEKDLILRPGDLIFVPERIF